MAELLTPLHLVAAFAALIVCFVRSGSARRLAVCGVLLAALGAAALALAPGDGPVGTLVARATQSGLPRYVLGINVALTVSGLALMLGALTLRRSEPAVTRRRDINWHAVGEGVSALGALSVAWLLSLWAGTAVLGWLAWRSGTARRWLLPLGVVPLLAFGWYARTVGDAWLLPLRAWSDLPISTAGARVAAAPIAVAALAWCSTAFSRSGAPLQWVAPVLFGWLGLTVAAAGLEALRPVLWPVGVGLVLLAAWRRTGWAAVTAGTAIAVLAQPEPTALALALPVVLAVAIAVRAVPWAGPLAGAALAAGGVVALPDVLRGEFVWSLALLLALMVAAWRAAPPSVPGELIP